MMVILEHASVAYPTMMGPLTVHHQHSHSSPHAPPAIPSPVPSSHKPSPKESRLTSGRTSPHRLHFDTAARVTCAPSSSDHLTPVNGRAPAPLRLFAHTIPVPGSCLCGGSFTNPGGTVHT